MTVAILDDHCVVCGCDCPPLYPEHRPSDTGCCRDGGTIELSFGYGSTLDTCYFAGVICDACAKAFIQTAAAKFTSHGALGTPKDITNVIEPPDDTGPDTMADAEKE